MKSQHNFLWALTCPQLTLSISAGHHFSLFVDLISNGGSLNRLTLSKVGSAPSLQLHTNPN